MLRANRPLRGRSESGASERERERHECALLAKRRRLRRNNSRVWCVFLVDIWSFLGRENVGKRVKGPIAFDQACLLVKRTEDGRRRPGNRRPSAVATTATVAVERDLAARRHRRRKGTARDTSSPPPARARTNDLVLIATWFLVSKSTAADLPPPKLNRYRFAHDHPIGIPAHCAVLPRLRAYGRHGRHRNVSSPARSYLFTDLIWLPEFSFKRQFSRSVLFSRCINIRRYIYTRLQLVRFPFSR